MSTPNGDYHGLFAENQCRLAPPATVGVANDGTGAQLVYLSMRGGANRFAASSLLALQASGANGTTIEDLVSPAMPKCSIPTRVVPNLIAVDWANSGRVFVQDSSSHDIVSVDHVGCSATVVWQGISAAA